MFGNGFDKMFDNYDSWKLDNNEDNLIEEELEEELEETICEYCKSDNAVIVDTCKYDNDSVECYECKTIYDIEYLADSCPKCSGQAYYVGITGYEAKCTKCNHVWIDDE